MNGREKRMAKSKYETHVLPNLERIEKWAKEGATAKDIAAKLGTQNYARLRFGIGNDFPRGMQIEYVLGNFTPEQQAAMPERLQLAVDAIKSFCLSGLSFTMTHYNNK